jgi:hypothetical protein
MNKAETLETIVYLQSLFPSLAQMDKEKSDAMAFSWGEMFAKMEQQRVRKAIDRYTKESGSPFPPSAAQVYAIAASIRPSSTPALPHPKANACTYGFCDGTGQVILKDASGHETCYECPCVYDRKVSKAQYDEAEDETIKHFERLGRQASRMMQHAKDRITKGEASVVSGGPKEASAYPASVFSDNVPLKQAHDELFRARIESVTAHAKHASQRTFDRKQRYCDEADKKLADVQAEFIRVGVNAGFDERRLAAS